MSDPSRDSPSGADPTGAHPKRRRPLRRRLQLLALTLGLCLALVAILLVVAEWILRSRGESRFEAIQDIRYLFVDEGDGLVLARNHSGSQFKEGRDVPFHTNNLGLRRGNDIGAKAPGERRVLVLGDSMVFGQGVTDDETFCAVLERRLSTPERPVIVGNAGMSGASVSDQLPMLRRALPEFEPDLVVSCVFLGNDFTDACVVEKSVVDGYPVFGREALLARDSWRFRLTYRFQVAYEIESFLFRHVPSLALEFPESQAPVDLPPPPTDGFYAQGLFMDRTGPFAELPPHVQGLWQVVEASFESIRDTAAPVPVAIVIVPSIVHVLPDLYRVTLAETGLDPTRHERGTAQRRLLALATELGIEAFDLSPRLSGSPEPGKNWLPTDRHLSVRGNERVAEWLEEPVRAWLQR